MKLSLLFLLAAAGCAAPRPSSAHARPPEPTRAAAAAPASRSAPAPDRHARIERDAAEVFRGMHRDLLACIMRSPPRRADATAYMTVDVLVGSEGGVRDVATTGGARLGRPAVRCMERRIARATFPPPHGGGTARIQVPFAFSFEP